MALGNWPTIMLLLEPPFDLGTKSLSTGFITLLISVLIFMYFSDRPWFSWPELLFRSSLGVFFKSVSAEASSDLLLLYVTSHTDVETWRLGPCNFFCHVHTQKLVRKPNLSAYTCMHYSTNLYNVGTVFKERIKFSIIKNFFFVFSTMLLCYAY